MEASCNVSHMHVSELAGYCCIFSYPSSSFCYTQPNCAGSWTASECAEIWHVLSPARSHVMNFLGFHKMDLEIIVR
jgi:hypothetical protein